MRVLAQRPMRASSSCCRGMEEHSHIIHPAFTLAPRICGLITASDMQILEQLQETLCSQVPPPTPPPHSASTSLPTPSSSSSSSSFSSSSSSSLASAHRLPLSSSSQLLPDLPFPTRLLNPLCILLLLPAPLRSSEAKRGAIWNSNRHENAQSPCEEDMRDMAQDEGKSFLQGEHRQQPESKQPGPGFAARGPEAIGKAIDTPRPNLVSCLPGWLADSPSSPSLPAHTPPPPLPCYGQMKTMQFSLFHTSLYVDILLQEKKCLSRAGGSAA
ncbi:unnamed protein product [Pleuronectes platessa]|uniref:Uncharacterized protein n=1 Tax=Pleuronectes platessa TaxID=8262 RepID=A0A9N7TXY4_PLEPL|nr:unnamed protein product [Pleuronectes platessa]